jgi:hypothetical protein
VFWYTTFFTTSGEEPPNILDGFRGPEMPFIATEIGQNYDGPPRDDCGRRP